jgi:hypothetical protein
VTSTNSLMQRKTHVIHVIYIEGHIYSSYGLSRILNPFQQGWRCPKGPVVVHRYLGYCTHTVIY